MVDFGTGEESMEQKYVDQRSQGKSLLQRNRGAQVLDTGGEILPSLQQDPSKAGGAVLEM